MGMKGILQLEGLLLVLLLPAGLLGRGSARCVTGRGGAVGGRLVAGAPVGRGLLGLVAGALVRGGLISSGLVGRGLLGGLLLLHLLFHFLLLRFGLALHLLGLGLHLRRLVERDVDFVDVLDPLLGLALQRL